MTSRQRAAPCHGGLPEDFLPRDRRSRPRRRKARRIHLHLLPISPGDQSGRAAGCRARRLRLSRQCRGRRHRIGSARGARTAGSRSGTPVAASCALTGYVSSRCPAATPTTAPSRRWPSPSPMLAFEDEKSNGQCRVRMQRIGARLLVEDNGGCGGAGVSFLGFYRRKR